MPKVASLLLALLTHSPSFSFYSSTHPHLNTYSSYHHHPFLPSLYPQYTLLPSRARCFIPRIPSLPPPLISELRDLLSSYLRTTYLPTYLPLSQPRPSVQRLIRLRSTTANATLQITLCHFVPISITSNLFFRLFVGLPDIQK